MSLPSNNHLRPNIAILVRLAEIASQAEEAVRAGGSPLDAETIQALLDDPGVAEWLRTMREYGYLGDPKQPIQ